LKTQKRTKDKNYESRREDGTQGFRQVCGLIPPNPQKMLNEKKKVGRLGVPVIQ
jgi:hypothetical protein